MDGRRIEVLFVGLSTARIAWYRIVLPAMFLGCDWVGVAGYPPKLQMVTGYVKGDTKMPNFEDYDVVVIQQPRGSGWYELIGKLQSRGIKVLYEIDDFAHAIWKAKDHDFRGEFRPKDLKSMVRCMQRCDGIICSTEYIASRYARNGRTWVCPNGLDLGRYRLSRPERPVINGERSVTIGWAGATGHERGMAPWIQAIGDLMLRHRHVRFCSIGFPFADAFSRAFGSRAVAVPFSALETYPAAMTAFDLALAPAGVSAFSKGKSPLRALEAGALAIPIVADPALYASAVIDGTTGLLAATPAAAEAAMEELICDESLRLRMGDAARAHITSRYDMRVMCEHWKTAIIDAMGLA